ncbi:unnamed protein product [Rhizophagus irregularis]|nr:unnamed protein product [Rhizophagus irregularis]CAB5393577.1 unnamed protein product [Rhizophagus irregularis]
MRLSFSSFSVIRVYENRVLRLKALAKDEKHRIYKIIDLLVHFIPSLYPFYLRQYFFHHEHNCIEIQFI